MLRRLALLGAISLLAGCGDEDPTYLLTDGGSGSDAGGSDVGGTDGGGSDGGDDDAGDDATTDAGDDTTTDAGGDTTTDTGDDATTDAGDDTTTDTGDDTTTDTVEDEICDNGSDDDGDGATDCDDDDCAGDIACGGTCGDGALDDGEECDDGEANSNSRPDACRRDCTEASCGDGVQDTGEACDEGEENGFGRCTLACRVVPVCGDGITDAPEECDDGNDTPDDGCTGCFLDEEPFCGDGLFTPGVEECDAGEGCPGGTCTDDCLCELGPTCGDNVAEGAEECDGTDDGACGDNEFCNGGCACESYVCGDNSADGTEECDGTDDGACGDNEACSDACVCERTDECGNDIREGAEECDGADDSACGSNESCSESCLCIAAVCGNGVAEGAEECDGADDALCGAGRVCDSACSCDGPPNLDAFGTPVVGGANPVVIPALNRSRGVCDDLAAPHGLQVRVVGDATAPVVAVEVQRTGLDDTPIRVDLETPIPAGDFDTRVDLCLPNVRENRVHQITLVDDEGRRSTTRSFSLPTLGSATLSTLRVFLTRDEDAHVLQLTGSAPDANVAGAVYDLETDEGPIADFESRGWPLFATYTGGQYYGAGAIGGLLSVTFTITSYSGVVDTHGGLTSAARTATPPTTVAGSGAACVPATLSGEPTCQANLWCQPGATPNAGTCRAGTGGAPVLSSLSSDGFILNSDDCSAEFPNELRWNMAGTTNTPLIAVLLTIPGVIDEAAEIGVQPYDVGSFSDSVGICFSGTLAGETIQIAVVDEAGRTSTTRSYVLP